MRYHLKDNNEPGVCIARPGNCSKGNIEHFESKAEALVASEKRIQAEMEADGSAFGTTSRDSAPIQKDSYIPELEPYSFSGENIAAEIESRGKTGFSCPRCGRQSSATEVSSMVNGGSASCSCGNELTVDTANFSADHGSNRSSVSKDTKFFHASIVPIDEVIYESKTLRSQWINDQERKGMRSSEAVQKGTKMSAVLSEMGTTPQYAIDGMLADDAVGDGFYVYEIEANETKPGFYSLGGDDSSVDFEDPTGEAERLRAETGNHRGGYSFGSRYKDPGSTGFAADISTMTIRSKRWVSAEEASKSPSVYNLSS